MAKITTKIIHGNAKLLATSHAESPTRPPKAHVWPLIFQKTLIAITIIIAIIADKIKLQSQIGA